MALLQVDYLSKSLSRIVTVHMYIPNDIQPEFSSGNPHYQRATKTLYLLHGFSGNSTDWVTGSNAMDLSRRYNMAIIMPCGDNSFYVDRKGTGNAYETFIVQELYEYVSKNFGLSPLQEDNFIGGLSMGGFGAIRLGAKYNDKYGAVFGLSSAMIIHDIAGKKAEDIENMPIQIADYHYYENIFGNLDYLVDSDYNPEFIIKSKVEKGKKIQPIFLACGTEDALLEQNRNYRDFLQTQNIDLTYCESKGNHDWQFWTEYLEPAIKWLVSHPVQQKKMIDIPQGDMPGDKIEINDTHISKAKLIFKELIKLLPEVRQLNNSSKVVISVCGGSGVGKSEVASLLSHYFNENGIGSYTLSGDNYPKRIPMYNDAERLRVFRNAGMKALVDADLLTDEIVNEVKELQRLGDDANLIHADVFPWFSTYFEGAREGLKGYLGTSNEIDFDEVSKILSEFKSGKPKIWLKRMGRTDSELWYSKVDFSNTDILIVEWTHGNSDYYQGVDIPILLNSTPEETLEHRRKRNRDGKTDSPFTMLVLEIEQSMLVKQAIKAKFILSKSGEMLTYDAYREVMNESKTN